MAEGYSKWLMTTMFLSFLFYIQATCAVAFALVLLGVNMTHGALCAHYLRILGTTFATAPTSKPVLDDTQHPVIFLCNHRSWGDFWVDSALLGGTAFVARKEVGLALPCTGVWAMVHGWIWFINRGAKHAEGTIKWMGNFYQTSHTRFPGKGVGIYPEGTRTLEPKGLPLKPGGLASAYSIGWPVQLVISTNKEKVMQERTFSLGFGVQVTTCVSPPLWPKDYASTDDFIDAVRKTWSETWEDAYGAATVPRPRALLPGASQRTGRPALPGGMAMNLVRAVLVLAGVLYSWRSR